MLTGKAPLLIRGLVYHQIDNQNHGRPSEHFKSEKTPNQKWQGAQIRMIGLDDDPL